MKRSIRIALFGITGFGKVHLKEIQRREAAGEAKLVAAVAINHSSVPEAVAELRRRGTRVFESVAGYFAHELGEIDLLVLPTGIDSHEPLACQAMQAGSNVLLEKPATGSVDSLKRMIEAERAANRFCAVAFQHTYDAGVRALKQGLVSGKWGRILEIGLIGLWPRADAYYERNDWAGRLSRGGVAVRDSPVNNAFAHYVNLALFWSGCEEGSVDQAVSVKGCCYRTRPIETFDTTALEIGARSGAVIRIHLSHASLPRREVELRLRCERGEFFVRPEQEQSPSNYMAQMYDEVLAAAGGEPSPCYTLEMAGEHVRLVEMLHRELEMKDYRGPVEVDEETGQRNILGLAKAFEAAHGAFQLANDWTVCGSEET